MQENSRNSDWESAEIPRIKAHAKRRCPRCQSDKWQWQGAEPVTLMELDHHLVIRYRCQKCGVEFLVEEAKRSRVVQSADRCVYCHSRDLERCSREGADIELWVCRRCNAYMAVVEGNSRSTSEKRSP